MTAWQTQTRGETAKRAAFSRHPAAASIANRVAQREPLPCLAQCILGNLFLLGGLSYQEPERLFILTMEEREGGKSRLGGDRGGQRGFDCCCFRSTHRFATANEVAADFFFCFLVSPEKKAEAEVFLKKRHDPVGYFTRRWSQVMGFGTVQPWMFRLWLIFFSFITLSTFLRLKGTTDSFQSMVPLSQLQLLAVAQGGDS